MKTIVYLDLVILSNLFVNILFIKTIEITFHIKINKIRFIIALLVSTLSLFLFIIPIKYIYNLRYFIGILIGFILFEKHKGRLIGILSYYILNILLVGTLVIFEIRSYITLIIVTLCCILLYYITYTLKKINSFKYICIINNKEYIGFYDTGNTLTYNNCYVVFIDKKYSNILYKKVTDINISTITNNNIINIYTGPILILNNKEYVVYYSISQFKSYDILLNGLMEV